MADDNDGRERFHAAVIFFVRVHFGDAWASIEAGRRPGGAAQFLRRGAFEEQAGRGGLLRWRDRRHEWLRVGEQETLRV